MTGILLALLLPLLAPVPPTRADRLSSWRSSGPCGGTVETIVVDPRNPDVAYAGASHSEYATDRVGGVFKTTDGGATWSTPSLFGVSVYRLWMTPSAPEILYAALPDRFLKSVDGGISWDLLIGSLVTDLAIHPIDPTTLFAAVNGELWKSVDGGSNWIVVPSLTGLSVGAVAFDSGSPPELHAAVRNGREQSFARSADGGETWTFATAEFVDTGVFQLVPDPVDANVLYAIAQGATAASKTSDRGDSWSALTGFPVFPVTAVTIDASDHATVYAAGGYDGTIQPTPPGGGLFVSHDAGATWSRDERIPISLHSVAGGTADGGLRLYVGSLEMGVFRSDAGGDWTQRNEGVRAASSLSIAFDPRDPATAFALTTSGFSRTTDGGRTWTVDRLAPTSVGGALALSPSDPDLLFASGSNAGLVRSRDGGRSWEVAFEPGQGAASIAFDPRNGSTVYLASFWPMKSADGGQTWQQLSTDVRLQAMDRMAVDTADSEIVYGTSEPAYQRHFWRSPDGGSTWVEDSLVTTFGDVTEIVPDPRRPGTVWVATDSGLLRSTDSGISWSGGGFSEPISALTADGGVPETLYLGTSDGRLFRNDDGSSWQPVERFPIISPVRGLAADPGRTLVYVATEVGVFAPGRTTRTVPAREVASP